MDIYLGTEAANPADILLGYGLAVTTTLPLDDKPRRRRRPFREPEPGVVAWSLFQSLVEQHGIREALRIYSAMEAERKGPFQPGAKYDPDLKDSPVFVPPVVARMERPGTLLPIVVPRRRKAGLRSILPPRLGG